MSIQSPFTVFTKPWPDKPLDALAKFIKNLGFDGVELPVRPGYQVTPETVAKGLPEAARIFKDNGVKIGSISGPLDEPTFAACAAAGVPINRICVGIPRDKPYLAAVEDYWRSWDALLPAIDRTGVAIGVQNHCGRYIASAMQTWHIVAHYNPRQVCAVLDVAHTALDGEPIDLAIDIVWSHLRMVNFKNAYWRQATPPEAVSAQWHVYWTSGRHGLANWPQAAIELKNRNFRGDLCFTAEYSDHSAADRLIADDIGFARTLF